MIPTIPVHVYAWFGRAKKYATADVAELSVSADAFSDLQVFALTRTEESGSRSVTYPGTTTTATITWTARGALLQRGSTVASDTRIRDTHCAPTTP